MISRRSATVATVDQFIRHAESGFFGDDEEADCPFVWDARRLLSCRRRGGLLCCRPTDERPGEQEVEDASVTT